MPSYWKSLDAPAFTALDKSWAGLPSMLAKGYDPKKYEARMNAATQPPVSGTAAKWQDQKTFKDKLNYILKYGLAGADAKAAPQASVRTALISAAPSLSKLLGAKQGEVDQAVAWKKAAEEAQKETGTKILTEHPAYGNLTSGFAGAVGGLSMGATDAAARFGGGREQLEMLKKKYPVANLAGNVAGGIAGSFAIPGAGQALAAKGILSGTRILPTIARAGLNAATTAVPTAVTQAIATQDVGQSLRDLKTNLIVGTVLGGATEYVAGKLPRMLKAARESIDDLVLRAGGIQPKALKQVAQGGFKGVAGFNAKDLSALKEAAADVIQQQGLYGKQAIREFLDDQGDIWNQIDDAWAAAKVKPSDFRSTVMKDPEIMNLLTLPGADPATGTKYADFVQKTLDDVLARADSQKSLPAIRALLMKNMKNAWKQGTTIGDMAGDVSGAIRDAIDVKFVPMELKAQYPALLTLKKSLAFAEAKLPNLSAGSDTATRVMVRQMLGGAAIGGGLGTASAIKEFDPKDPSTWAKAGLKLGAATLGGAALNRLLASGQTQVLGRLAGGLRNVLPRTVSSSAGPALAKLAPVFAKFAGTGGIGKAADLITGNAPEGVPEAGTPAETAETAVQETEAATSPEAKEQAKEQVNTAWADRIREKLNGMYDLYIAPQYGAQMTREQFVAAIAQATEDFDPRYTAGAIFPDKQEREQYLRSYESAMKLQTINLDQALEGAPGILGSGIGANLGIGGKDTETKIAYDQLRDFSAGLMAEPGKMPEKRVLDQVTAELNAIIAMKVPLARKKQLIRDHLANWGLDLDKLAEYGLVGGAA